MSYLGLPRLNFAGLFEADVNTVNNDVRNYDISTFEPRFQTPQVPNPDGKGTIYNGWWNPDGTNAFRLIDCAMTGGAGPDGMTVNEDPALKLSLQAQYDRSAAKIVDLDPQFQFASALWGLRIVLTDGTKTVFSASFLPTCFRDIYFGRLVDKETGKPVSASPGASARFTGTLEDIVWDDAAVAASPLLELLQATARKNDGRLTMSLMTYGYSRTPGTQGFTFGSLIGTIGPWLRGQPLMFAPSRRFAPNASSPNMPFASASGIGFMDGAVSADGSVLSLDFGNALPMWQEKAAVSGETPDGYRITLQDLGPLRVVVLRQADFFTADDSGLTMAPSATDGDALAPASYEDVGILRDYDMDWLRTTGGIAALAIPEAAQALIGDHPIAILSSLKGGEVIAIRETIGGVWVRADNFVQRVDAAASGWVESSVSVHAMKFGKPYAGAPLSISLMPPTNDAGGSYPDAVKSPQTDIPEINVPASAVSLPSSLTTDTNGVAQLIYHAANPDNPRGYIDGQIYMFAYGFQATGQSAMPSIEQIAVHVRDAFVPPKTPSWETDIAPVLVQYGNLYPIMSRGLFSFSDYNSVAANARILYQAFTRSIEDPNYMPATRDMSAGKLRMIIDWLAGFLVEAPSLSGALPVPPEGSTLTTPATPVLTGDDHPSPFKAMRGMIKALGSGGGGKATATRGYTGQGLSKVS